MPANSGIDKVEDLKEFPFQTFAVYKKALSDKQAKASIDKMVAVPWTRNGIHSSPGLRRRVMFFISLTPLSVIAFIVYLISARHWLLFLALPVLLMFQHMLILRGNPMLITLLFAGLAWGVVNQIGWLMALTLLPLVYWYTNRMVDRQSVAGLAAALESHEDLLCLIWNMDGLRVTLANGNEYCSSHKIEAGKFVAYEK